MVDGGGRGEGGEGEVGGRGGSLGRHGGGCSLVLHLPVGMYVGERDRVVSMSSIYDWFFHVSSFVRRVLFPYAPLPTFQAFSTHYVHSKL